MQSLKTNLTCGGVHGLRVVKWRKGRWIFRWKRFPILSIQTNILRFIKHGVKRLRAELPRRVLVLRRRGGEAAG